METGNSSEQTLAEDAAVVYCGRNILSTFPAIQLDLGMLHAPFSRFQDALPKRTTPLIGWHAMLETMILRFRDLSTDVGETIRQHKLLIAKKQHVWWGWWKKQGETIPVSAFQLLTEKIRTSGQLAIYLFDTGTLDLYRAELIEIRWHHLFEYISSPDRAATPDYYGDSKYMAWFKLLMIDDVPLAEQFLKTWSYVQVDDLFESKNSIFTDFYDKQVVSFSELKHQDRTIWFIRQRQPSDRTHELHVYDRARKVPSHFPQHPISSSSEVILWVSDVHFGEHHNFPQASNIHQSNLSEALRKDLDAMGIKGIAGLVVSGDLTWKANATEFESCFTFLNDVKSWATLTADQIIICPGNHDLAFSKEPWNKGLPVEVAPETAIKNYVDFYQKLFYLHPNEFLCSGRRLLIANGIVVEIASLNSSMLRQTQDVFQGQGYLSDAQLDFAASQLGWRNDSRERPKALRIVMLHHHVVPILYREVPLYESYSSLVYDAGALCRWLSRWEVSLVLHGHMHDPAIVKESRLYGDAPAMNQWREFVVAGMGSTGVKIDHTTDKRNSYGILRFGRKSLSVQIRQISSSGYTPPPGKEILSVDIPYEL